MDYNYNVSIDLDKLDSRLMKKGFSMLDEMISQAYEDGMQDVTAQLIDRIKENLNNYGLGDSGLAGTIDIQFLRDGISIRMKSEYAIFVEYGTGFAGQEGFQHPHAGLIGWVHRSGDVSSKVKKGWYYPTVDSDPNPHKHVFEGQLYGWTRGIESRPFMYDTWKWGVFSATNIINGHVNRAIKRWELSMK